MADEFRSLAGAGRNESIRRAFQVMECLSLHPRASVAEVARETGLPRATVTRVLATLAGTRVVAEATGPWMVSVGSWLGRTLTDPASGFRPHAIGGSRPPARQRAVAELQLIPHTRSTIRSRRALLAELDRIAQADHAEVIDEFEQGLAGMAVPVGRRDRIVGFLAIYLPTARLDAAMRQRALEALRATARSLTGASDTTTSSSSSHAR